MMTRMECWWGDSTAPARAGMDGTLSVTGDRSSHRAAGGAREVRRLSRLRRAWRSCAGRGGDHSCCEGGALAIQADVTDEGAVCALFDRATELGPLTVLVNNAGITGETAPIGLARDVAAEGIRVNCVSCGFVDTEINACGGRRCRAPRPCSSAGAAAARETAGGSGQSDPVAALRRCLVLYTSHRGRQRQGLAPRRRQRVQQWLGHC